MTNSLKSIHQILHKMDDRAERLAFRHPLSGLLFMFIGLPILTLFAIFLFTFIVTFPIAWGLGLL